MWWKVAPYRHTTTTSVAVGMGRGADNRPYSGGGGGGGSGCRTQSEGGRMSGRNMLLLPCLCKKQHLRGGCLHDSNGGMLPLQARVRYQCPPRDYQQYTGNSTQATVHRCVEGGCVWRVRSESYLYAQTNIFMYTCEARLVKLLYA